MMPSTVSRNYLLCFGIYAIAAAHIDREAVVRSYNPIRYASSNSTPLQVGNGNFAFGADVTGLQTFEPFNTLSSWCWHNSSLPTTVNQTTPSDFTGLDWWTHGRLVNYDQPNPAESDISQWMISNPQRVNFGRIGLWFGGVIVNESGLTEKLQTLDLYTGIITSSFKWNNERVEILTAADPDSSTVSIELTSNHIAKGLLGVFFDYPYMTDTNKFEDPFVGNWTSASSHKTNIVSQTASQACIRHDDDMTSYLTTIAWSTSGIFYRKDPEEHRYILRPRGAEKVSLTVSYHAQEDDRKGITNPSAGSTGWQSKDTQGVMSSSKSWWQRFWQQGAFVDLTRSHNTSAHELQRRVILSQYLLAVNSAGYDPPQESGLVNNGWYGKFHAEMFLWNIGHWARWGRRELLDRAVPGVYERFLDSSIERAGGQGYRGARWGKMLDPSGRSAPGEINSLLIWQQPHALHFAEYEWRDSPTVATLQKWNNVLFQTAEFMADYAYWNQSTSRFDLGPPIYPVSENTNPNMTINAAFELAYWRFGLGVAIEWQKRQSKPVLDHWERVYSNLAPLPVSDDTYVIYEGIPDMWNNSTYTEDHPSMLGLYGWLPPQQGFNISVMENTYQHVLHRWNLSYSYGWDFPMLSMSAARLGHVDQSVDFLLDAGFEFDDAGYPIGGARVPTPYMPASASLLWAMAFLAGGWDGDMGSKFPDEWKVEVEGFQPAL
ncbi:hypothetical protein CLAFUR0_11938 [Fulvia fulva]|nr:hypothetical protein CLAFUR0_11938 [Fulvia fulva]